MLSGHSGCTITQLRIGSSILIRKTSSSNEYNSRLQKQRIKQSAFDSSKYDCCIQVPRILHEGHNDDGLYYFDMEYVHNYNIPTFLSRASLTEVNWFLEILLLYLDRCANGSLIDATLYVRNKAIDSLAILERAYNESSIVPNVFLDNIRQYYNSINEYIHVPGGYSHNDLTFSNILYVPHPTPKLFLIDFLDSDIESPIIDRVKLAQDINYGWTMHFIGDRLVDRRKIDIISHHMRKLLSNQLEESLEFQVFQMLNFLSILKYAKRTDIQQYIVSTITSIIESSYATHSSNGGSIIPLSRSSA